MQEWGCCGAHFVDPLFRVQIIKKSNSTFVLLIFMHHIISDPLTLNILIDELSCMDEFEAKALKQISQFRQFVVKENSLKQRSGYSQCLYSIAEKMLKAQRWVTYGSVEKENQEAGFFEISLSDNMSNAVIAYSKLKKITLFFLFFMAFIKAISVFFKQHEFSIGFNVSRRYLEDYSNMMGPLSEQAIINVDVEMLKTNNMLTLSLKNQLELAFGDAYFSSWQIVNEIKKIDNTFSPNLLFNTLFDYEPLLEKKTFDGMNFIPLRVTPSKKMRRHLTFRVAESTNGFNFQMRYRKQLFELSGMEKFSYCVIDILQRMISEDHA